LLKWILVPEFLEQLTSAVYFDNLLFYEQF